MTQRVSGATGPALIFIGVMVGLAMAGGAVGLATTEGFARFNKPPPITAIQTAPQQSPEPRLQVDPLADRAVMAAPDRLAAQGGPGRLPVAEAMRRLAVEGWPETEGKP